MNQYDFARLSAGRSNRARSIAARSALACALAAAAGPMAASAQVPVSRVPAAPAAVGLDSLSEDAVMSELSGMKLDSLLAREFDVGHVPKDKQESIKSLGALRELSAGQALGNNRRLVLVKRAVDGLNALLPTMNDPTALMTYTGQLLEKGIEPDVNTLEFWGENPVLQARVKPAADIASRMLEQVATLAEAQETQVAAGGFHSVNDPRAALWERLDKLKGLARYIENMMAYYRAVAIDTSGGKNAAAVKERAAICDVAITYLQDLDAPVDDPGGVQPRVHNRIGKLAMTKGDYTMAKTYFNAVVAGKTPDGNPIQPAPSDREIYEARYFSVVCDVLARKPDVAEQGLTELLAWQKKTLPPAAQDGVDAAADMLRYRLLSMKAELAKTDAEKEQLNKQADGVLMALEKTHPEFTQIITEQLVNRMPDKANLNDQPVSVLDALIAKGDAERLKPETIPLDEKVVNRAVAAARILLARTEGVTPREKQDKTLFIALLLDRQNKPLEAANALLDFAKKYSVDPNAGPSVNRAVTLAYTLAHGPEKDNPQVKILYDTVLNTATKAPWSRKDLAYLYADHLRTTGRPHEAIAFYRQVPAGDKMAFQARYLELSCMKDELDNSKLPLAVRQQNIADARMLVDQIRQLAPTLSLTDTNKLQLAKSTLLGAWLAIQEKQPAKALQLLASFDADPATGANQSEELHIQSTSYRAQAYIADKQFDKATDEVIKLSQKSPDAAQVLATDLLGQLKKDYDREQEDKQTAEMAETASNEAKLTNFMVDFCQKSSNPKIKALVPEYQLYDADMKLNAGSLAPNANDRKQKLTEALNAYQSLKDARLDDIKAAKAALGIGLTEFALGQWSDAGATLGTLLHDRKLGEPHRIEHDNVVDNPVYWEAKYKWIKSNYEQARALPNDPTMQKVMAAAKQALKDDFVLNQESTGGEKWARQYAELRKEMVPDFDPHALAKAPATNPSTPPTSAPVLPPATQPSATQPVAGG